MTVDLRKTTVKFKPKPTVDREATEDELKRIKESEEMLKEEKKLPPTSQMVRDLAITHWKSLKAFMKGKHVISQKRKKKKPNPRQQGLVFLDWPWQVWTCRNSIFF